MPVTTRSRSKRGKKEVEQEGSGNEKTPRRSARIAAQRSRSREIESSQEGREHSMTPVSNPGKQPQFSGITLGSETLGATMKFLVPEHEAESPYAIRQHIRNFSESPLTLKQKQNRNSNRYYNNDSENNNENNNNDNINVNNNDNDNDNKNESDENENENENDNDNKSKNSNRKKNSIRKRRNSNSSMLSPNRFQFMSKPSRVPEFDDNKQTWSFAPESEVPQLARNLAIFIVTLIVIVLAVVFRDELFAAYNEYMPSSFSNACSTLTQTVTDWFGNVYNMVTNMLPSQETLTNASDAATDAAQTVTDAVEDAADAVTNSATTASETQA